MALWYGGSMHFSPEGLWWYIRSCRDWEGGGMLNTGSRSNWQLGDRWAIGYVTEHVHWKDAQADKPINCPRSSSAKSLKWISFGAHMARKISGVGYAFRLSRLGTCSRSIVVPLRLPQLEDETVEKNKNGNWPATSLVTITRSRRFPLRDTLSSCHLYKPTQR